MMTTRDRAPKDPLLGMHYERNVKFVPLYIVECGVIGITLASKLEIIAPGHFRLDG